MLFLMAVFALMTMSVQAQTNTPSPEVFDKVEVMPEYPGGMTAMIDFMIQNVKYPKEAEKQKLEGRTLVSFIVEKDGSLSEIEVLKSSHPLLDNEALRVVGEMPKWKPGQQKGKPVRVRFVLPVSFALK